MGSERLSNGLSTVRGKKAPKVLKLTQNTYQQIVKVFDHPSKVTSDQLVDALQVNEQEKIDQHNKIFAEKFQKPIIISMPHIKTPSTKKRRA